MYFIIFYNQEMMSCSQQILLNLWQQSAPNFKLESVKKADKIFISLTFPQSGCTTVHTLLFSDDVLYL